MMDFDKEIIRKTKGNLGYYAVLGVTLFTMAFFGVCSPKGPYQGKSLEGSAGEVDGEEITRVEFIRAYERTAQRMREQYQDQYDPKVLQLAQTVLSQLIDSRILGIQAKKMGISASEDEVVALLKEGKAFQDEKGQFSEELFQNYLRNYRYSEKTFLEENRLYLATQKLREFILGLSFVSSKEAALEYRIKNTKLSLEYIKIDPQTLTIPVSPEEIATFLTKPEAEDTIKIYYDNNKKDFEKKAQIKASHILFAHKNSKNAPENAKNRTPEESRLLAQGVIDLLKSEPDTDFKKLATEKTDEASGKTSGGDLGLIEEEDMVEAFSKAAFAMEAGQISDIVETEFGFHIIKVWEKFSAQNLTLEQARDGILHKLIQKDKVDSYGKNLADRLLEAFKKSESTSDLLASHNLSWSKTGPFALNASYISSLGSVPEVRSVALALKEPGKIHDKVISSGKSFYLVKLEKREEADMGLFNDEKKKEILQAAAFSDGYSLYMNLEKKIKKEMEDKKKIYKNPSYLALDLGGDE